MSQLAAATASVPPPPIAPVGPATNRIDAIDACRGFALLGIFIVNIGFFSRPLGDLLAGVPPAGATLAEQVAHYVTSIFFSGKFYAQFSMLFGIGLVLQMNRVQAAGRKFVPLYLRRLAFLLALGFIHAIFLWYGDILFTYATVGLLLLLFRNARPKTLFVVAAIMVAWVSLLALGLAALGSMAESSAATTPASDSASATSTISGKHSAAGAQSATNPDSAVPEQPPEVLPDSSKPAQLADQSPAETSAVDGTQPADESAPESSAPAPQPVDPQAENKRIALDPSRPPLERMIAAFQTDLFAKGPKAPLWMELETQAYQKGGYWQATGFRAITWVGFLVFELQGFWWHVIAMFFLGAGLFKAGLFEPSNAHWHRRFAVLGATVGIPLATVAAFAPVMTDSDFLKTAVGAIALYLSGPLMALMYIGLVTLFVWSGRAPRLCAAIANVGRMALTNYLTQTVVATFIFYWFGLGYFDKVSGPAAMAIVVGIYLVQIVISNLWLAIFRFGPMEWLWRTFTYLNVPPLLR